MKNKKYIIIGLILLAVLAAVLYFLFGGKRMTEKEARLEMASQMKDIFMRILTTPIDFYGKVVDQDGKPLAGVKVPASMEILATDHYYWAAKVEQLLLVYGNKYS